MRGYIRLLRSAGSKLLRARQPVTGDTVKEYGKVAS
jgi:hypothetical protein